MNGEKKPAVSVVMPAYNAGAFLEPAALSVLEQDCGDWELLIVDDGSTDGTAALAASLAARDARVRPLSMGKNAGVAAARNFGIQRARADWVAFLDSDDLWRRDKLSRQLALLAEKPETDLCYTGYALLKDGAAAPTGAYAVPERTDLQKMLKENVISTSGAMVRRSLLLAHPFQSGVAHEDLCEWLTLLRAGAKAAGLNEPLHTVRVSRRESRSGNKLRAARDRLRLYRQLGLPPVKALYCWLCYAVNGVRKYAGLSSPSNSKGA